MVADRGSRIAGRRSQVRSRGRESKVAVANPGENDLREI